MNATENRAYLNWRMSKADRAQNYGSMADGYRLAAIRLLDSLIDDNVGHDADVIVFPVLFCAHQSLELYLKATRLYAVEAVSDTNPWDCEVKSTHNLTKLISSVNSAFPQSDNEKLIRCDETRDFFDLVDLLEEIGDDQNGSYHVDFARYPESSGKKGRTSYSFVKDDRFEFRLDKLKNDIEKALSFMDGFCSKWAEQADSAQPAKAEYGLM